MCRECIKAEMYIRGMLKHIELESAETRYKMARNIFEEERDTRELEKKYRELKKLEKSLRRLLGE